MRILKIIGITLLVLAVLAAGTWWALNPGDGSARASTGEADTMTAAVTRGSIEELVGATGSVAAESQASLIFLLSGQVDDIYVEEGDRVEEGQVLARIDSGTLDDQVARAEASLATAQARLVQARRPASEAEIAAAQAAIDGAKANLAKAQRPAGEAEIAAAQAAIDGAKANLAKAQRSASEAEIAAAQAVIDGTKANLAKAQRSASEDEIAVAQAAINGAKANLAKVQRPASEDEIAAAQAVVDGAKASLSRVLAGASEEDLQAAKLGVDSANNQLWGAQAQRDSIAGDPRQSGAQADAAEAQVHVAAVAVQQAQVALAKVQKPPFPEDTAVARSQVDQAEAQLAQLLDRTKPEDVVAAQSQVDQAEAQLAQILDRPKPEDVAAAQSQVDQADAQLVQLLDRPKPEDVAAAQSQVDQAEAQLAQSVDRPKPEDTAAAQSQVDQAEAQLAQLLDRPKPEDTGVAEAQVREAQLAVAQAQGTLEDASLLAPFAGTVLEVLVDRGEWASASMPAIVLADTDDLILKVNVDEIDVAQLAGGQTTRLTFDALTGQEIDGTLTRIFPASTRVGGAVAYGVEIRFSAGDLPVRIGMTADVDIVTVEAKDALLVPNRAITADREAGRYYVTRRDRSGKTERIEIKIGLRDDHFTQVIDGLNENDSLVLAQIVGENENAFEPPMGGASFEGMEDMRNAFE